MDRSGAQEILMPFTQPAELWEESGRWGKYDEGQLLKFKDRHDRDFCFGPTHEEIVTDIARNELRSHKQLPVNYYQIQTKFRDETRPRFGLLRAREFLMKDAYSFHISEESLQETYDLMHQTYCAILERIGVEYRPVLADSGAIGGDRSMEFHVLADAGEDLVVFSSDSDYAANIEKAEAQIPTAVSLEPLGDLEKVATPGVKTIADVAEFLKVSASECIKTLLVEGDEGLVALIVRGDHELNPLKAEKLPGVLSPLKMADDKAIKETIGATPGSIGPRGLSIPVIVDHSAAALAGFCAGANEDDYHFINLNWQRDCGDHQTADIRNVVEGDISPDGKGTLQIKRGIEVGHIFQLGDVYSRPMNATVLDENGKAAVMQMGCYGMGVSRLVGAVIEQFHDDKGIIWPISLAPFQVVIVPINAHKSEEVMTAAESLYNTLSAAGIEVLLDDREARPGVKFADAELIGIPHRLVVGDRGLKENAVEYMNRATGEGDNLAIDTVCDTLIGWIKG